MDIRKKGFTSTSTGTTSQTIFSAHLERRPLSFSISSTCDMTEHCKNPGQPLPLARTKDENKSLFRWFSRRAETPSQKEAESAADEESHLLTDEKNEPVVNYSSTDANLPNDSPSSASPRAHSSLLQRGLSGTWDKYYALLEKKPLIVKSITAFFILGGADLCAQGIEHLAVGHPRSQELWNGLEPFALEDSGCLELPFLMCISTFWTFTLSPHRNRSPGPHFSSCSLTSSFRLRFYWLL